MNESRAQEQPGQPAFADADERWRDRMISALDVSELADATINFRELSELTTFGAEHLSSDSYALRKDEFGNVIGIEAGRRYQCDDPWLDDEGLKIFAQHREEARLSFPTTAKQLIHWIRNQGGDVQPQWDETEGLLERLRAMTVEQSAPPPRLHREERHGRRFDAMAEEIEAAFAKLGQHANAAAIWDYLLSQAGKSGSCISEANAKIIIWINAIGTPQKLERKTLGARLRRRAGRAPAR